MSNSSLGEFRFERAAPRHQAIRTFFLTLLVIGGVLGLVAYMLALFAYTFAPLSYSGAIREVSAVIGAFLGWRFLKEEMGGIRVVGSAIVFAGVMVIAVFG